MSIGWKKSLEGKPKTYENLHKIYIANEENAKSKMVDPAYEKYGDKFALRAFFHKIRKKREMPLKEDTMKIKFTVFLEPVPYLCVYRDGDEELEEFKPVFFENFRHARHLFVSMLDIWYKKHRSMRKASELP